MSKLQKSKTKVVRASVKTVRSTGRLTKDVTQFDESGAPLRYYPSLQNASEKTKLSRRGISMAANGKIHMFGGCFWRLGNIKTKIDLSEIKRKKPDELIHEFLKKRLKIKITDARSIPPFLNLSLKDMKGEQWKDVPTHKGLYQVSTLGRVKALSKVTNGKQQKWRPEQIQHLVIDFRKNKAGKEIAGTAFASMAKPGSKKLVSVARWVYYLFVKKFDIKKPTSQIHYKDKNPLNLNYKNLFMDA